MLRKVFERRGNRRKPKGHSDTFFPGGERKMGMGRPSSSLKRHYYPFSRGGRKWYPFRGKEISNFPLFRTFQRASTPCFLDTPHCNQRMAIATFPHFLVPDSCHLHHPLYPSDRVQGTSSHSDRKGTFLYPSGIESQCTSYPSVGTLLRAFLSRYALPCLALPYSLFMCICSPFPRRKKEEKAQGEEIFERRYKRMSHAPKEPLPKDRG